MPAASNSGKYFWFCRMVRIRHSCGTVQERLVELADVDARVLDQRRDLVEQGLIFAEAGVLLLRFGLQLRVDLGFALARSRPAPCLRRAASSRIRPRCASTISPAPMKRWPRVRCCPDCQSEHRARHDARAVQHHQAVHRPHELRLARAPAHDFRNRQRLQRFFDNARASTCIERRAFDVTLRDARSRLWACRAAAAPIDRDAVLLRETRDRLRRCRWPAALDFASRDVRRSVVQRLESDTASRRGVAKLRWRTASAARVCAVELVDEMRRRNASQSCRSDFRRQLLGQQLDQQRRFASRSSTIGKPSRSRDS